jgi:hypothetical protein
MDSSKQYSQELCPRQMYIKRSNLTHIQLQCLCVVT